MAPPPASTPTVPRQASSLGRLLDSEYEDYLLCGLGTLATLLRAAAPLLREGLCAPASPHAEERRDRCAALQDALRALEPRMGELSGGRGRAGALAARTLKTLRRCAGSGDEQAGADGGGY